MGSPCGRQLGARKAGPSQIKGDLYLINHFMETQHVSCASLPFTWTCVEKGWDQEGNSKFIIKILSVKKLETELSHNPAMPLLGIHTEENRNEGDTCTPVVITALFTIARTWKQPRYPSGDKWIRKLWYIYTMQYYSTIKKNTFESALMRWMQLEPIIQSEVSQKEKHQFSILMHIYEI